MAEVEAGPETKAKSANRKTLKVVSNCTDLDKFVVVFGRFYDGESMFLLTRGTKPAGTEVVVLMCLTGGKPVFKFEGKVEGCYDEKESPFGRPGMRIGVSKVDPKCEHVAERLVEEAKKHGLITATKGDDGPSEEDEEFFEKATVVSTPAGLWETHKQFQDLPWIGGHPPEAKDDEQEIPTQIANKAQRPPPIPTSARAEPEPPPRAPVGSPDPDEVETSVTEADEKKVPAKDFEDDPARAPTMLAPKFAAPEDIKTNPAHVPAAAKAAEPEAPVAPQGESASGPVPSPSEEARDPGQLGAPYPNQPTPTPPPRAPALSPWEQAAPGGSWGYPQQQPAATTGAMPPAQPSQAFAPMSPADLSLRAAGPGWGLTLAIAAVAALVGFAAGMWFSAL